MRKSRKTFNQMQHIQSQLKYHEKNIAMLSAFSKQGITWQGKEYKSTKEINHRIRWTIKNIKDQMVVLRHELTVLMEYGA